MTARTSDAPERAPLPKRTEPGRGGGSDFTEGGGGGSSWEDAWADFLPPYSWEKPRLHNGVVRLPNGIEMSHYSWDILLRANAGNARQYDENMARKYANPAEREKLLAISESVNQAFERMGPGAVDAPRDTAPTGRVDDRRDDTPFDNALRNFLAFFIPRATMPTEFPATGTATAAATPAAASGGRTRQTMAPTPTSTPSQPKAQGAITSPSGIDSFLTVLRTIESGGDYNIATPALGAYQIMPENWNGWATEAGISGANWRDPAAQDRVARYKAQQYYARYGNWDLVAAAWFAGPSAADLAAKQGIGAIGTRSDSLGTSVTEYLERYREASLSVPDITPTGAAPQPIGGSMAPAIPGLTNDPNTGVRSNLMNILSKISNAVAGGQRSSGYASPIPSVLDDGSDPIQLPGFNPTFPIQEGEFDPVAASVTATTQNMATLPAPAQVGTGLGQFFPVPGYFEAYYNNRGGHTDFGDPREYRNGVHQGTDIGAPLGTPIVAPANGTVTSIHTSTNGGNVMWVTDSQGRLHKFMHLSAGVQGVGVGTPVQAGQTIAFVGNTGSSSTPHLHYELHVGGRPVDPWDYLNVLGSGAGAASAIDASLASASIGGTPGSVATAPPAPASTGTSEAIEESVRNPTPTPVPSQTSGTSGGREIERI